MARKNKTPVSWVRRLAGTLEKIIQAVEEAGGTFDNLMSFVADPVNRRNLGLLVMGKLKLREFPCQRLVPHLIPDGWEVVEDVEPTINEGVELSFPSFLRKQEAYIGGPTMRIRAKEMMANKGLSDVPALLGKGKKGHETILFDLRDEVYIVLAGTLLRGSGGHLYVPYLDRLGDERYLSFGRLAYDWGGSGRLVSCE